MSSFISGERPSHLLMGKARSVVHIKAALARAGLSARWRAQGRASLGGDRHRRSAETAPGNVRSVSHSGGFPQALFVSPLRAKTDCLAGVGLRIRDGTD